MDERRQALISSEEKYRSIFQNASEGIFQSSPAGQLLDVNRAAARIFRYRSPEEMMSRVQDVSKQIYVDQDSRQYYIRTAEKRGYTRFEFQFRRKDNTLGWAYASMRAVRDRRGKTAYYEGFFVDITERKQMIEKLREAHDFLEKRVRERTRAVDKLNRELAADIAQRKKTEKALRAREKELERRSLKLHELNITLRTLLEQRDLDRKNLERQIMSNLEDLVMPALERLNAMRLPGAAASLVQSLAEHLERAASPFLKNMGTSARLTPAECQVADFIKRGKRSKEIGAIMKLSTGTVNFHRNRIRRKLGLRGQKVSLQAWLIEHS